MLSRDFALASASGSATNAASQCAYLVDGRSWVKSTPFERGLVVSAPPRKLPTLLQRNRLWVHALGVADG
jgi:hypothetical protein